MTTLIQPRAGTKAALAFAAFWFAGAVALGAAGVFETRIDEPPLALIGAVLAPTALFAVAFAVAPSVRAWTRSLDLALLTLPHAWRTVGFVFLVMWFVGVLPGAFAAPAGFGDLAIAVAAPFVAAALILKWSGAIRAAAWLHVLGVADFAIAVAAGVSGVGGAKDTLALTDPMTAFPLVLIPAAAVPLLLATHVMALVRIGCGRASEKRGAAAVRAGA